MSGTIRALMMRRARAPAFLAELLGCQEGPTVLKSFFAMREAEMRRCGLAAIRHSEIKVNLLLGQNGFDCVQGPSMKAEYLIVGHHRGRAHENYPLALGWQAAHWTVGCVR
jgi:hypothetical protein